jgi:hydrogenase nickel incorporation protein HypB
VMFRTADLMLISKTDLLAVLDDFHSERAQRHLRELANPAAVVELSAKTGDGIDAWVSWLKQELQDYRSQLQQGETLQPAIQPEGQRLHKHAPVEQRQPGYAVLRS